MSSLVQFSPRQTYERSGFVVMPGLVSGHDIDAVVKRYQTEIRPSSHPFFRQNTNRYEANQHNDAGHVRQSFLDIHDYQKFPEFSAAVRSIVCGQAMQLALETITGAAACNVMQTMLFDANTHTPPHQDWWYLDSVPNGHLVGAWIALEDIDARSGRFFVIPNSTDVALHQEPGLSHRDWMRRIDGYYQANTDRVEAPALKKGDVLFWNSRTVHGSLATIDPQFSRKSITAHFLPSGYAFGNLFVQKDFVQYKQHAGVNFYRNQPDYSPLNQFKFQLKQAVYNSPPMMKLARQVQRLVK
jgi:phytanoyl-CoA hydroxylase